MRFPLLSKILFAAGLTLASFQSADAQIQVGSATMPTLNRSGSLSDKELARFKATKTLFVLLDDDFRQVKAFEDAIRKVWTVTPFQIIRYDQMDNYLEEGKYSFFMFGGYVISGRGGTSTHLTYDLAMLQFNRKGEVKKGFDYFSRTVMYPTGRTLRMTTSDFGSYTSTKKSRQEGMGKLYAEGDFYDWGPGFLMGKLDFINKRLVAGETAGNFSEVEEKPLLPPLAKDTLFVPEYVNIVAHPVTGEESQQERDESTLKEDYPYPLRLISSEELNARILSGTPTTYLLYTKSSGDKFINVYQSEQGRIYSEYTPISFGFKLKDLKKLAKAIRK